MLAKSKQIQTNDTITIRYTVFPESPSEWVDGHVAELYTWHRHYNIGEDTSDIDTEEGTLKGLKEYVQQCLSENQSIEDVLFWPVFLYDHGGQCLYLHENFPDRQWDGSHIGWLVVNPHSHNAMGMTRDQLEESARATFRMWDSWVRGDIYTIGTEELGFEFCYGDEEAENAVIQETHGSVMRRIMQGGRHLTKDEQSALFNLLKDPSSRHLYREYALIFGIDMPSYEGDAAEMFDLF